MVNHIRSHLYYASFDFVDNCPFEIVCEEDLNRLISMNDMSDDDDDDDDDDISRIRHLFDVDFIDDTEMLRDLFPKNIVKALTHLPWTSIIVDEDFPVDIEDLSIMNYSTIQYISIGSGVFYSIDSLTISNMSDLKLIIIGTNSFPNTSTILLSGNERITVVNRSSSTYHDSYWRTIIPKCRWSFSHKYLFVNGFKSIFLT